MAVDDRVTNARVMVEEKLDQTDVRVTNARVQVEEKLAVVDVRVTNTRVMIEYKPWNYGTAAITEAGDTLVAAGTYTMSGVVVPVRRPKTPTHTQQFGLSIYVTDPLWKP